MYTDAEFVDVGEPLVGVELASSCPQPLGTEAAGEDPDRVGAVECTHRESVAVGPDEGEGRKC